ncbi:hypothetical protein Taro_004438 [Colocasia esculenta]|uniref:DNA (cytosine-5-)-methyltransferase n=1 Tax=Colocasia esculenta TaxID=4460 RepID=A0A843TPI0_COLES|nr:hypothetical protein [Colocasia esculenta]
MCVGGDGKGRSCSSMADKRGGGGASAAAAPGTKTPKPPLRLAKDDTKPLLRDPILRLDPIETEQAVLRLPPFLSLPQNPGEIDRDLCQTFEDKPEGRGGRKVKAIWLAEGPLHRSGHLCFPSSSGNGSPTNWQIPSSCSSFARFAVPLLFPAAFLVNAFGSSPSPILATSVFNPLHLILPTLRCLPQATTSSARGSPAAPFFLFLRRQPYGHSLQETPIGAAAARLLENGLPLRPALGCSGLAGECAGAQGVGEAEWNAGCVASAVRNGVRVDAYRGAAANGMMHPAVPLQSPPIKRLQSSGQRQSRRCHFHLPPPPSCPSDSAAAEMAPKTPATATRRSQRLEMLGGMSEGGSQAEGSAPKTKSPPKEEAAAAAGEGVKENGSGRKKRVVAEGSVGEKSSAVKRRKGTSPPVEETKVEDEVVVENEDEVEEEEVEEEPKALTKKAAGKSRGLAKPTKGAKGGRGADDEEDGICQFVGESFSREEARQRWPHRYKVPAPANVAKQKNGCPANADEEEVKARCHYRKAQIDDSMYELYDDVYVKAGEGEPPYIGRIVELFESIDGKYYFTSQWFFRAEDTVMKEHGKNHDERRVFLSEEKNDNILDCIVSKVKIVRLTPNIDLEAKESNIPPCDLYYDMAYSLSYATFANIPSGNETCDSMASGFPDSFEETAKNFKNNPLSFSTIDSDDKPTASLLDLYSGCGAMSTGLCLGAQLGGMNLETRWAVDFNKYACESLKLNHPNVQVRNEKAEDFLELLREWEILCRKFLLIGSVNSPSEEGESCVEDEDDSGEDDISAPRGEFEVGKVVGICYGDPGDIGKIGLKFKVRWKGYGPSEDTWEPIDGLSKCSERIEEFVKRGYKSQILPLPGQADVICGGPPCQGISGFNRFRNYNAPLDDPKNLQMKIFMEIVDFLKPKYVLMENVVDIVKFVGGYLGRYAIGRLVSMNYQTRLGLMVAGCYGLPQFRMRVFLWGARPSECLPQFPLPTHNVIQRGGSPNEFEDCVVAYDENQPRKLEKALVLQDAISDLPLVTNDEERDEMSYGAPPKTDFQHFIRRTKSDKGKLYDHRPLKLNQDDYDRVCQIPKEKGANFRNLRGVRVRDDNTVEWDPKVERVYLASGKPLVPDYAMSFIKGKSCKPFARLWWDETVPTVVTRAEPHNQADEAILHPEQDRVLTIRENARLQGFPDYYKLCGPIKERYIQVGNAVAVPVARALGYALGLAFRGVCGDQCLFQLPFKFPRVDGVPLLTTSANDSGVVLEH